MQINWESFKVYNQDTRGIRFKFEDLCRQLFANENISGNKQFRYLHANPNNPGLETEPIYDEQKKRWVGFQVKYFDSDVDYSQIKDFAEKTVKYHTGKVDLVFLFCNKSIKSTAKGFEDAVNLLKKSNIDLQLITNDAILDLVREKYPYLGLYYFGNHSLNQEWFIAHTSEMFEELGERYNSKFNVETGFSDELALFVHSNRAVDYLNSKKKVLIEEVDRLYWGRYTDRDYLRTLKNMVVDLPDVDIETLHKAFEWFENVSAMIQPFTKKLLDIRKSLEEKKKENYAIAFEVNKIEDKNREVAQKEYWKMADQINDIETLIELPKKICISEREKQLLCGKILMVSGRAGAGKSQLLASWTKILLDNNKTPLLLVAGLYFTDEPIQEQIMKRLRLDYKFEDLIDILESIGEKNNTIIPIFIDAINETWNRCLWKQGLSFIIEKIEHSSMLKLVLSYRTEYEKLVLPESIQERKKIGSIISMIHSGFENNSSDAIKKFLDYYNIPFTPLEYLSYEMSNPLFLTLYCKTYDGQEVSLPTLYNRVIKKANQNIIKTLEKELISRGYSGDEDFLNPLIRQIVKFLIEKNQRAISKEDLIRLSFWSEYGLVAPAFIQLLVKENILYDTTFGKKIIYYFAYDQMNDYYCAETILELNMSKEDVKNYLKKNILNIKDGIIYNYGNIDLFVTACALYAEKFKEECINIIDDLNEEEDRKQVFLRYVYSFQWRDSKTISVENLESLLNKYFCDPDDFWPMLIGNSMKISHPLNAVYLHGLLSGYKLNHRDYLWTIYINRLTWNESDRIVQLVEMYNQGKKLEIKNEKQLELLLILFSWLLTSSNRWLRDYTSKAMIEILKNHFQFCQLILEKFKDVNDPYVIQRLYGIVFGACCKRENGNLQSLAEYVYNNIFNQEKVYPDILLRDYARLIIERFLFEHPDYVGVIDKTKIIPPYNSDSIPEIEDQHYEEKNYDRGAMLSLVHSMRFEGMGFYGDFGRYVFQSALHYFDVNDKKMFNYAIYYILNNLGLTEKYFEENDSQYETYDRHRFVKIERIGKKYQWITMYNMLARISDHCKMIDQWGYPEKQDIQFEGAWNPYVRDFDPTLNSNFLTCDDAPAFDLLEEHLNNGITENKAVDISDTDAVRRWLKDKGLFLEQLRDTLVLEDNSGQKWMCLTKYCDTGRKDLDNDKLLTWSWLYAYFMTSKQAKEFSMCAEKELSVINNNISSHHKTYSVFNREYPWSPSCYEFEKDAWIDARIKTGEKEIGKILHATTDLLWEEQYDATKEEPISQSFPCGKLIRDMGLRQLVADGFFYDINGKLAAFDTDLTQKINSVVVRKDILDEFLVKIGMKLVWLVDAEKEIYVRNYPQPSWSNWEAVFVYEGDRVAGDIYMLSKENA